MQVWNVLHAARWKYRMQKNRHLHTITQLCRVISSQLRQVSTIGKKIVKQQYLLHTSLQYGELQPTSGWDQFGSLGTWANFNGFCILASLQRRCRSPEANQTLYDLWPSPGRLHYIYIFGGFVPWRNFATCKIHFASKSCILVYCQRYCTALQQRASAKLSGVVQGMELRIFRRRRHLYLAGRPSLWASAHILVLCKVMSVLTLYFHFCLEKPAEVQQDLLQSPAVRQQH